jgi:hypothetical protein
MLFSFYLKSSLLLVFIKIISLEGKTENDKKCKIPFLFNGENTNFCVESESKIVCQVQEDNSFDECKLGL